MPIRNMNDALTLMHLTKPFKDASLIIDAASTENEMLLDMPSIACNRGQVHGYAWYDDVPKGDYGMYNTGIKPNNTQVQHKQEGITLIRSAIEIDKQMVDDSGDKAAMLNFESRAHIEGMGRQQAYISMYGNRSKDPRGIDGFATRVRTSKCKTFENFNVDPVPANTAVTSIYIAALGPKFTHFLYSPTFGNMGVKKEDMGVQKRIYSDTSFDFVYNVLFAMEWGIAIEHPDALRCIGNIDVEKVKARTDAGKSERERLIDAILHAQHLLPKGAGTYAIYGNLDAVELIEKCAREKEVVVHPETDPWGKPVTMINGMRVRRMDVIPTDKSEIVK